MRSPGSWETCWFAQPRGTSQFLAAAPNQKYLFCSSPTPLAAPDCPLLRQTPEPDFLAVVSIPPSQESGERLVRRQSPGIHPIPSLSRGTQTPCTRGVQGMLTGCTRVRPVCIPGASGVHPLYTARGARELPRLKAMKPCFSRSRRNSAGSSERRFSGLLARFRPFPARAASSPRATLGQIERRDAGLEAPRSYPHLATGGCGCISSKSHRSRVVPSTKL